MPDPTVEPLRPTTTQERADWKETAQMFPGFPVALRGKNLERLISDLEESQALLRAFADSGNLPLDHEWGDCFFCEGQRYDKERRVQTTELQHEPDCTWLKAKNYFARRDGDDA